MRQKRVNSWQNDGCTSGKIRLELRHLRTAGRIRGDSWGNDKDAVSLQKTVHLELHDRI